MSSDRGPSLPSQTGLAPGSVSTGPASALMSGVMDSLGMLGYSNHGPWSVSDNIGQRLRHGPRVTGATLPGSHSHTELRVTAR